MKALENIEFLGCVGRLDQLPGEDLPEIAFAGRSNVGKSSLINAILGRKSLMKVSSTPGRTQTINFLAVGDDLRFVDLPGYGYAKVSKSLRKQWGGLIADYLAGREQLAGVVVILDIRRDPSGEDLDLIEWLREEGIPTIIAVTKSDKLSKQKGYNRLQSIAKTLGVFPQDLFPFSAVKRTGKDRLMKAIFLTAGVEED